MEEYAIITYSISSLKIGKTKVLSNPEDPNLVNATEIIWTNEIQWETIEAEWSSFYKTTAPATVLYVDGFRVGIVHARTSFTHIFEDGD